MSNKTQSRGCVQRSVRRSMTRAQVMLALENRILDAMKLSDECKSVYIEKGYERQESFALGQLDAFQAVLNWMKEAPPNAPDQRPDSE